MNGGTILQGKVYVWYWIRTRMPKRVWKRCMEFKITTEAGKLEAYYIDRRTGTAYKVLWGKFQKRLKFKFSNLINKDSIEGLFTK